MKKIAIDIALLLPQRINNICIVINRKINAEAYSNLSKKNNHPHITLAMGVISEDKLAIVKNKLEKIGKRFKRLNLEIFEIHTEITPENKKSLSFTIKSDKDLTKLHKEVMDELLPIFSYGVKKEMFFIDADEKFNEVSKYWVKNYGKKHSDPKNYHPHISLKCRNVKYRRLPLKFTASKIAICHLGNYCTCRKIFKSTKLRTSPPA